MNPRQPTRTAGGGNKRLASVNSLIQRDLSFIIKRVLELPPGSLVTITKVKTGPDLQSARVFISIMPDEKAPDIMAHLVKNKFVLQQELFKNLKTKFSPKIEFIYDEAAARANRIEKILDELQNSRTTPYSPPSAFANPLRQGFEGREAMADRWKGGQNHPYTPPPPLRRTGWKGGDGGG